MAVLLILVLGVGFYVGTYRPPRRVIAQVETETIRLGDLIPAARILSATVASGAAIQPQQVFNLAVGNEVLERAVASLGIEPITPGEVDRTLARIFDPSTSDADNAPTALSSVGRRLYDGFLANVSVTDAEYRAYITGDLLRVKVNERFQDLVEPDAEAVLLHWIVAATSVDAQTARDRIDGGEPFAEVAAELNTERNYSDTDGEVGWVPRGAFSEFDETIFGAVPGQVFGPISSSLGFVVLQVSDGPRQEAIAERVLGLVASQQADSWFAQQYGNLVSAIDFDFDAAEWLFDNVR